MEGRWLREERVEPEKKEGKIGHTLRKGVFLAGKRRRVPEIGGEVGL